MSHLSLVSLLDSTPLLRRAEAKRKMADFARARSEYHQQRADYWYRVQTQCEQEACELEDEAAASGSSGE